MRCHYKNRKGFTLAEILITLGIIGVVAALTINSIVVNYQKNQTVAKLKKVYSTLKQATEFAKNEYGNVDSWDFTLDDLSFAQKYYIPFLSVLEDRGTSSSNEYIYTDLSGISKTLRRPLFILSDGTYLFFLVNRSFDIKYHLIADINGSKLPNKVGRDIFVFSVYNDALQTYNQYIDDINGAFRKRSVVLGNGGTSGQCNKKSLGGVLGSGSYCSRLIEMDGWTIAPDYPW